MDFTLLVIQMIYKKSTCNFAIAGRGSLGEALKLEPNGIETEKG